MSDDLVRWLRLFLMGFWRVCLIALVFSAGVAFLLFFPLITLSVGALILLAIACVCMGIAADMRNK